MTAKKATGRRRRVRPDDGAPPEDVTRWFATGCHVDVIPWDVLLEPPIRVYGWWEDFKLAHPGATAPPEVCSLIGEPV